MATNPQLPPDDFLEKMEELLSPEAYQAFRAGYSVPARKGLRVNALKIAASDFISKSPFSLEPMGGINPATFLIDGHNRPGRHPYHHAGLYYLQEPSAAVAAALLAPRPGELVLDLAAAPGGKATHLASLLNQDDPEGSGGKSGSVLRRTIDAAGLLVANDIHIGRARLLAGNLARWGCANTLTISSRPEQLLATWGSLFDRVLVDAPCSGEGMFRKQPGIEWSQRMVTACATRQTAILDSAAGLVRPGGFLLYVTCTFSPEENEAVIARFLADHTEFVLVDPERQPGFGRGRPEWIADQHQELSGTITSQLERTVRLWPHHFPGEGHFLALMERSGESETDLPVLDRFAVTSPAARVRRAWQTFARDTLINPIPSDRLHASGRLLFLLPETAPATHRLRLVRYGMRLGESRGDYFRPHHDLALALNQHDVTEAVVWQAADPRIAAYLAGEDIPHAGSSGWVLITVEGYGLGWAKRTGNRLKNHYPHGLRQPRPAG